MSPRRTPRQLVVAVLVGVLVGGGLLAVTPAGAEVTQVAATNWKKIWKKNLQPLADKRYYTKTQSDTKYQPKGSYETAGSGYSKAEADAKYSAAGSAYSKAEIDAKFAPLVNSVSATSGGDQTLDLTPTVSVVRAVSLMPPSNGMVIVSSSAQIETNAAGIIQCSISLTNILAEAQYQVLSGQVGDWATIGGTRGFTVTKGNLLTVNLVCHEFSGQATLRDPTLTAIFAPS